MAAKIIRFITRTVERVNNSTSKSDVDLYVIKYVGGGTGSASFPALAALFQRVSEDIGLSARIHGVGLVPRLRSHSTQITVPRRQRANTLVGLREYGSLLGVNSMANFPLDIEFYADAFPFDAVTLQSSPLSRYYLYDVPRDESGLTYPTELSATVRALVTGGDPHDFEHSLTTGAYATNQYPLRAMKGEQVDAIAAQPFSNQFLTDSIAYPELYRAY